MAKNNNLTDFLTGIADKIREVENSSDLIDPQDFEDKIEEVSQKYIPRGEYVLAPLEGCTFKTGKIDLAGYACTYMHNGELYADYIDELDYYVDQGSPYIELYAGQECKIFVDGLWEDFDNNTLGGYLFVNTPIPVTAAQWEDFKTLTYNASIADVTDYRVTTQPEEVLRGVEFAVDGNILMGAMPMAEMDAPYASRNDDVISFGATVSQGGYIDAGTPVGVGTYTMPAAVINKPDITISSSGLITAQADSPEGGYVQGPFYTKTKQLPTKTSTDVTANGPTVSIPSGYYPAGLSKTVTTVARGATTISVAYGTGNAMNISAANTQSTGYVTGSTASSSMKVYVTRTDNKVYLRPGSTSATAIASIVVPTAACPSPTITLNTATGVITATYKITTAGYVAATSKSSSLTIELAEDNEF